MAKIALTDLTTNYGSQTLHNTNNATIEDHLNSKVLYRNNPSGEPNQMENDLDMNSNDILNAASIQTTALYIGGGLVSVIDLYDEDVIRYRTTMAAAVADTSLVVGMVLRIGNRANSLWDVVLSSGVTENGYNVVQCTGVATLSLVLRINGLCIDAEWGAVHDGSTDNTAATQAAALYAETNKLGLFIAPSSAGTVLEKIDILTGGITIAGYKSKIIHKYSSVVQGTGGSGSTKCWPVFMIHRDADLTEITNHYFTSHSSIATVQASLSADWYSYLAHIAFQHADNVHIHNNTFAGTQPRAIFGHGGSTPNIHDNVFIGQGILLHVGFENNPNFWDAGAADSSVWYSTQAPILVRNKFQGYVGASGYHCIFLSGTVNHTVTGNKILGMNQSGADAIRVYTNDYGITDSAGTPILEQGGTIKDNVVRGTFAYGLLVNGYSTSATSQVHKANQDVEHNDIQGTGGGIFLERFNGSHVHRNIVKTTGSPLNITRDISNSKINGGNWFECTGAGTSAVTLWMGTTLDMQTTQIEDNDIVSPAGDQRAIYAVSGNFDNSSVSKNRFQFSSTVASPTVIAITVADGYLKLDDNEFTIASSTMANRPLHDIAGTAQVSYKRNTIVSSTVQLGTMEIAATSVDAVENTNHPALTLTVTDRAVVADNDIIQSTTGTGRTLTISGAAWANVHNNRITATASLGVSLIMFSACTESRLLSNRLVGNTSVPLVRINTSGDNKYWGNEQTNNGAGGVTYTTSGTATATAMIGT